MKFVLSQSNVHYSNEKFILSLSSTIVEIKLYLFCDVQSGNMLQGFKVKQVQLLEVIQLDDVQSLNVRISSMGIKIVNISVFLQHNKKVSIRIETDKYLEVLTLWVFQMRIKRDHFRLALH